MNTSERAAFRGFDPEAEVEISERNLPHWFQPGAAMFITFRTADSLPQDVIQRWRRELEEWLAVRQFPISLAESTVQRRLPNHEALVATMSAGDQREFKRRSDQLFHRSLDECHGACLLRQPHLATIVADVITHFQNTKYDLDRFVVMPNHVHVIVQFRLGTNLTTVGQSWMRYSARQINQAMGQSGTFWQPEPFDHIIRSPDQFTYLQGYIADNPKKANLAGGEYLYWHRQ